MDENPVEHEIEKFLIGTAEMPCYICDELTPLPIMGWWILDEEGRTCLVTQADMTEAWYHSWIHEDQTPPP